MGLGLKVVEGVPADLYITAELASRTPAPVDHVREKRAIQDLAAKMVTAPEEVLPRFVDVAMELTGGVSAGLSLYEDLPSPGVFRWKCLRGALAPFEDATTPRDFSPCGVTLDQNAPVLSLHPERFYNWISDAKIVVPEVLLVPLYFTTPEPQGTLWIVSEKEKHFNREHVRIATELATFVGIAIQMVRTQERLQVALEEQETLTKEMSHRLKNLFAVSEGMVRMTMKTANTVSEMGQSLIGRFHALATAHALIRRSFSPDSALTQDLDVAELISTIVQPHERQLIGRNSRFVIEGSSVKCGQHSVNGIALIFHELATNAVKYGALANDKGRVGVSWKVEDEALAFHWHEFDGPELAGEPQATGFGSKLLTDTVTRQFGGSLNHGWERSGLRVQINIPLKNLSH